MNRTAKLIAWAKVVARQALFVALAAGFWVATSPLAWAAKKKAAEAEAEPTKGYTMAYLIVLVLVGMGLMVVCRPSGRRDKADEKKDDESESK
jgi:hypothetical protein